MFLEMETFPEWFLGKREAHTGVVMGARSVVQQRVVHTLHIAVHVRSHGKRRRSSTFLILVHIPFFSGFNPVHVDVGISFLVKILWIVFLRGLDEFHVRSSVFPCNGYDSHTRLLRLRKLSVNTLLLGFTLFDGDVFSVVFMGSSGASEPGLGPVNGFLD